MSLQEEITWFCQERGIRFEVQHGKAIIDLTQGINWNHRYFFNVGPIRVYPINITLAIVGGVCIGYILKKCYERLK